MNKAAPLTGTATIHRISSKYYKLSLYNFYIAQIDSFITHAFTLWPKIYKNIYSLYISKGDHFTTLGNFNEVSCRPPLNIVRPVMCSQLQTSKLLK